MEKTDDIAAPTNDIRKAPMGKMMITEVSSKEVDTSPTELKKTSKGYVPGVVLDSATNFADFGLPEC